MKKYKLHFVPLSPIHIGTGEEISPFDYVIKKDDNYGGPVLYRIDLASFLSEMNDRQRRDFDVAVNKSGITWIRHFIRDNIKLSKNYIHYCCPVDNELAQKYEKNFDNPDNQLIINPCIRRIDNWEPIIPGSSIKGAIRTAIVSKVVNASDEKIPFQDRNWEGIALGYDRDIRRDPFRALSIEDISMSAMAVIVDSKDIYNPNRKSGPDPAGISEFYERLFSKIDGEDGNGVFGDASLTLYTDLQKKEYYDRYERRDIKAVAMNLGVEQIAQACRDFYLDKLETEHHNFYRSSKTIEQATQSLRQEKFEGLSFPIRIGHFSHCECVTIDKYRQPRTRRGKNGEPMPWGKTRALCCGELPFGWAKITLTEMK